MARKIPSRHAKATAWASDHYMSAQGGNNAWHSPHHPLRILRRALLYRSSSMIALSWLLGVCGYCAARPAGLGYAVAVSLLALALLPVLAN